ncbi:MAG: TIR domain-containing protein [Actinobacteria bacterium]|jgi:class 3 adenylate cyclase/tetratricopeptide (TPR) repeat protein|nr:MAG: TIR domain-containing protein [Actinomycetota bacterium]
MGNIFISHVIADEPFMRELVQGLEQAGYTAWFFERDVLPGISYLIQITQAMEACDAVVLLVTPAALSSDQVTKEVVGAFERRIPFIPVLLGVTPPELKERQPEWRHALGGTAMLCAEQGLSACVPRVVEGLKALGIKPGEREISTTASVPSAPSYISEKILSSRSSLQGERKQVTVLFADVVGFTPLSEKLDPEEVGDLIRPTIDIMAEEIHRYEGTIAQFLGDGLMALFGAPLAHEDAPHRALYAALAIQRRLAEYGEKLKPRGMELSIRIGINTGLVIVGRIGDDLTMEYTALGDTVNLASRMESSAEPGMVQVAESTYRLTDGYFDFSDLGEIEIKGKADPVHAYQVLVALPTRGRVTASLSRDLSPFVGRGKELDQLNDRYQQAKAGSGQVVGIVGEPGVGKSRLLLQFRVLLPEDECTYLEGGCIHYGEAIAYLPILGILRSYFDIHEGEEEAVSKQKMEGRLASLGGQLPHILPPLQELLSLEVDDQAYLSLEPAQRRERVFEAARYPLTAESLQSPLVLAIEDLHWIDKTTEEFLSYFIEGMPTSSILLLLLYRPDYTPAWASKTFYSQIRVDYLPQESSIDLIKAILFEGEVSPEISDLIMEKTAGNPLFIEELTRGLLESGSIVRDNEHYVLSTTPAGIQIPDTIQGIIASRLDRLAEELKETMQVASVIGREFSLRLLEEVTGISKPLKSYLMQLQSMEFIYEKSLFPEPEYIFKHALTQEVAYGSLLLKRRKEMHGRIGQAIERLYPGTLEDFYETLAYHHSRSEDTEKAIHYLKLAGDKAAKDYSNWEAVNFYKEAISFLDTQPETGERKGEKLEIYLSAWSPMTFLNYPEGSLGILQQAERIAEDLKDERYLVRVYRRLGLYHTLRGNNLMGLEYSEKSFDMAERIGEIDTMARSANDVCTARNLVGDCLKVADTTRKALQLLEEQRREQDLFAGGFNVYSQLCGWCVTALGLLGELDEARSVLNKGLENAFSINDTWGIGWIEASYVSVMWFEGNAEETISHSRKAIECFEETGIEILLGTVYSALGFGYSMLGDHESARYHAANGIRLQRETGVPVLLPEAYLFLAWIYSAAGEIGSAMEAAREALRLSVEHRTALFEMEAWIALGSTLGVADPADAGTAEQNIRHGIGMAEEKGLKLVCAKGYLLLGELFWSIGLQEEALENLKRSEGIYREIGVPPSSYWLTRTREASARLESAS